MANKIMLRKDIEKLRQKYRFDKVDIGSKCEPHTRKWILILIFAIEITLIYLFLDEINNFFEHYDWAKTSAFVIFSLPFAFYLWMWRNHDKNIELTQKEIELKDASSNAVLSFFNICMEKIIDVKLPIEIRQSYLTSFLPYIRGDHGIEYELQSLTFIDGILRNEDIFHAKIRTDFAKSFDWYIQNGMFLFTEFHDMKLDHFHFSGISIKKATFVNCDISWSYWNGSFNKAMLINCDLSKSTFKNCHLVESMFMGCNLSECTFYKCNVPFSILRKSNISGITLLNSKIDIPANFPVREEIIYIIYTDEEKDNALTLANKFPNAVCKQIKDIPSYFKNLTGPADLQRYSTFPEAEWKI